MSFDSSLKIFCKFESSPIINSVDASTLTLTGSPSFVPAVFGNGIVLSPTVNIAATASLTITNAFSVGFWLKPVNPGMINNSGTLVPINIALVAKSGFATIYTLTTPQFVLYESTNSDGTNILNCYLFNGSGVTLVSPSYTTGVFHHFVVVYSGSGSPSVTFYIDGVSHVGTGGTPPSSLSSTSSSLYINGGAPGTTTTTALNTGTMDSLFVSNRAISSTEASRAYSLGLEYVFDSVLSTEFEIDNTAVFTDISTTEITSVLGNDSDVFVGRSDGALLRGFRSIWQSRRSFDSSEAALLESTVGPQGSAYTISNGVLDMNTLVVSC